MGMLVVVALLRSALVGRDAVEPQALSLSKGRNEPYSTGLNGLPGRWRGGARILDWYSDADRTVLTFPTANEVGGTSAFPNREFGNEGKGKIRPAVHMSRCRWCHAQTRTAHRAVATSRGPSGAASKLRL
jgi:hypothetical protein